MQFELGLDTIRSYRRLSYTPWHALAEFVDNSTQSYFNNREILDRAFDEAGEILEVDIVYERADDTIRISDNSIGMSEIDLSHALRVGARPIIATGRSQFGMGLKTASCWLGNSWTVRTKKLGEDTEYSVSIDVDRVAEGHNTLALLRKTPMDKAMHYTVVEIKSLNRVFQGRTISKIKQFLASMYRTDLRNNELVLRWRGERLHWEESDNRFAKAADGSLYKKDFAFVVNGKDVSGWIGVLDFGHGGRPNAGFSIMHSGRVIKGFPESWRPEAIFGQFEGSNDLINQRITGEIYLDAFEVSHTKDDIQWLGDEETELQDKLNEEAATYVAVAKDRRRRDMRGDSGPSDLEVRTAIEELQNELSSSEMADLIDIELVPPPAVVQRANVPVLESVASRDASFYARISSLDVAGFLVGDGSPNDPYVTVDATSDSRIVVVVNTMHPYMEQLSGTEGVLNHLRHCTYDAIAEWQARQKTASLDPDTIKALKDRLLRLPAEIEMQGREQRQSN